MYKYLGVNRYDASSEWAHKTYNGNEWLNYVRSIYFRVAAIPELAGTQYSILDSAVNVGSFTNWYSSIRAIYIKLHPHCL